MKVEDIYIDLFENYRQLRDVFQQVVDKFGDTYERQMAEELAGDLGIITRSENVVDAYEELVKKRLLFAAKSRDHVDASKWVGMFNQQLRLGNMTGGQFAIQEFSELVYDSLLEIKQRREEKEGKKKYKVIHKAPSWIMFKPEHKAAACSLGSGTTWCISSRGDRNYFNSYSDRANVYIIHARQEKFAILIEKGSGTVFEVQTEENNFGHPDENVLKAFAKKMAAAGVDVGKVEELLDIVMTTNFEAEKIEFKLGVDGVRKVPSDIYEEMGVYTTFITITGRGGFREEYEGNDMIFVAKKRSGGYDVAAMLKNDVTTPVESIYITGIVDKHPAVSLLKANSDTFSDPDKEDRFDSMVKEAIIRDLKVKPFIELIDLEVMFSNIKANR